MERILGLDLGTTSVGWCLLEYEQFARGAGGAPIYKGASILAQGVRIFPEGMDRRKGEKSLNQDRREARSLRRQGYRRARRKQKLKNALQSAGLLPNADDQLEAVFRDSAYDPYGLRAAALHRPLLPIELGRALYHLGQRRGFLSNRKSGDLKEDGKVKFAISELSEQIRQNGCQTLGEYLHGIDPAEVPIRGRYTARAMYLDEFDKIWNAQAEHHPQILTIENRTRIHDAIFDQRPLRPQRHLIGHCTFFPDRKRAYAATIAAQDFRLWQSINHLKITLTSGEQRWLTDDERHTLAKELGQKPKLDWGQLRKRLGLFEHEVFNLEAVRKSGLLGNQSAARLGKAMGGKHWKALGEKGQRDLVFELLNVEPETALRRRLIHRWSCDGERADALIAASAGLPKGVMHLSHKALTAILPYLKMSYARLSAAEKRKLSEANRAVPEVDRGLTYADACLLGAGIHHSEPKRAEIAALLPFPGKPSRIETGTTGPGGGHSKRLRIHPGQHADSLLNDGSLAGELRNPFVVRALYQVRRVVNALIREYGKPDVVRIELARDLKQNAKQRDEADKQNKLNYRSNEDAKQRLNDDGIASPSREDIQKFRLWQETKTLCPYCDNTITFGQLFETGEAEVEHIIPYSRCLDNSMANKTVAHRHCNADKGNRTPWEAYSGERYEAILRRVKTFPYRKRLRFYESFLYTKDGMERDFVSQQLNETRYIARKAVEYLTVLGCKVQAVKGGTTALLRHAWGLNALLGDTGAKNRRDHRHHAVDALVVALTEARAVQVLSTLASLTDEGRLRIDDYPVPIPKIRELAADALRNVIVSHKVSRKTRGQLHDETIYAVTGERTARGVPIVAVRKLLDQMDAKTLDAIRDPHIRRKAQEHLANCGGNYAKAFRDDEHPFVIDTKSGPKRVRKVRILDSRSVKSIGKGKRQRHVWTRSNHHMEIVERTDDKGVKRWRPRVVSTLEAHTRKKNGDAVIEKQVEDGERFVMSLNINDMLIIEHEGEDLICRVQKMDQTGEISLRPHFDADPKGKAIRKKVNALRKVNARKIHVDMLGRYREARE